MDDKELRNPKRAIELAEKAVAIERSPSFLDTLAEAYFVNGSIQKAIEKIKEKGGEVILPKVPEEPIVEKEQIDEPVEEK